MAEKEQTDVCTGANRMCDVKTQLLQQMLTKKQQTVSTFLPLLVLFSVQKDAVQKVMCFSHDPTATSSAGLAGAADA